MKAAEETSNLAYSCLIDGSTEHRPITVDEAEHMLRCWQEENSEVFVIDDISPEDLVAVWNDVLRRLDHM